MIRVPGHVQEGGTSPSSVDWTEPQGWLFAFAFPEVLMAFKAASEAGQQAERRMTELSALIVEQGSAWRPMESCGQRYGRD